jgi:hypothetical protein
LDGAGSAGQIWNSRIPLPQLSFSTTVEGPCARLVGFGVVDAERRHVDAGIEQRLPVHGGFRNAAVGLQQQLGALSSSAATTVSHRAAPIGMSCLTLKSSLPV